MRKTKLFYLFLFIAAIFTTACSDKDDDVTLELKLSTNKAVLLTDETATVNIEVGNDGYVAKSENETIATASITDKAILIVGKKAGETNIAVTDYKGKKAMVKVIVKPVLSVENSKVTVVAGETSTVAIKAGTGKYTVTSSDETVAKAVINGQNITITAVAAGTATITITDTDTGKTQEITVTIKPTLVLEAAEATIVAGESATVKIVGGTGQYSVASSDEAVATATIAESVVTIQGVAAGTATVTVTDTDTGKTQDITATINPVLAIDKKEVSMWVGESNTVTITSGTGKYTVASSDKAVATATIAESVVTIQGVAAGTATITVTDTNTGKTQDITATVKVKESPFTVDDKGNVFKKEGATVTGDVVLPKEGRIIVDMQSEEPTPTTALCGNKKITSIDFNNVTTIGQYSVANCTALKTIHLRKVSLINLAAFYGCTALKKVYAYMEDPSAVSVQYMAFVTEGITLYVPKGKLEAYKDSQFKNFFSKIKEMD